MKRNTIKLGCRVVASEPGEKGFDTGEVIALGGGPRTVAVVAWDSGARTTPYVDELRRSA